MSHILYSKFFSSRTLLPGIFFLSSFFLSAYAGEGGSFRDSLYHHISRTGFAELTCQFNYPLASSSIYPDLGTNRHTLSRLDSFIHCALAYTDMHIKNIRLTGYSSVEGSYTFNEQLSRERTKNFYQYLNDHYSCLSRYPHDIAWVAEDWSGLSHLVGASTMNERDEILSIIHRVRSGDTRKALLRQLNGGRAYQEMLRELFPRLRRVDIRIEFGMHSSRSSNNLSPDLFATIAPASRPVFVEVPVEKQVVRVDTVWVDRVHIPVSTDKVEVLQEKPVDSLENEYTPASAPSSSVKSTPARRKLFAVKTNALSWLGVLPELDRTTFLPNLAFEYYFHPRWSVEFGASYSYWHHNGDQEFQGISAYHLEPRFRLPLWANRLDFYVGVFGRMGDYDIKTTLNYTEDYWSAGVSTGLYVHFTPSWGMELGARAGYVKTDAIQYTVDGSYNYFAGRKPYSKFNITDWNVSLVYRFR